MSLHRRRFLVRGIIQGVGFRPFVARVAAREKLGGNVLNTQGGVLLEVEGKEEAIDRFSEALRNEAPPNAYYSAFHSEDVPPLGELEFRILPSRTDGQPSGWILPDLATCLACEKEVRDSGDRRRGYPFLSCTACGPRFSIVKSSPYDRERTSMSVFPLCPACAAEYGDPSNRRFHAETTACQACGPRVWLEGPQGTQEGGEALDAASEVILSGQILALRGLGGFLLLCDATREDAVRELRERKRREARPFAVMFPAPPGNPLSIIGRYARLPSCDPSRFVDAVRPIVILPAVEGTDLARDVDMGLGWVGAYLPTTALHALLLDRVGKPVVSTSGNPTGEPILTGIEEGRAGLDAVADAFLLHDRPILRGVDDSVVRPAAGREIVLRRARGMAPLPVAVPFPVPPVLAVGGHQKVALALGLGDRVAIGPHIGDLETVPSLKAFEKAVEELPRLLGVEPELLACDRHPRYASTRWARTRGLPLVEVQHHHAHIAAVMGEAGIPDGDTVLGLAWDGTGWGPDGRIWGGELLACSYGKFERFAAFRPFPLLGGERAVREPRRVALALLLETLGEEAAGRDPLAEVFDPGEMTNFRTLWRSRQSVECTSVGRLFDGFSALLLRRVENRYEGEAAMRLESASAGEAAEFPEAPRLEAERGEGQPSCWIDWRPWVEFVLSARDRHPTGALALGFHRALVRAGLTVAGDARRELGNLPLALSGGCFQNAVLVEEFLRADPGVLIHRDLPPNDGGISYGQVLVAAAALRSEQVRKAGSWEGKK